MRTLLALAILALIVPLVHAEAIIPHSPPDNGTFVAGVDKFTFSVSQEFVDTNIDSCSLILGDQVLRTMVINGPLGGTSRHFTADVDDGEYRWRISCLTEDGRELVTAYRSVTITHPPEDVVDVESSGITRGSLRHEFTMKNSPSQPPITVPKVAPGDFVKVNIDIPPSTMGSDFYVKRKYAVDGKNYLLFEYKRKEYELPQGENVTLPVGTTNVIALFDTLDGSRATLVFFTTRQGTDAGEGTAKNATNEPPSEQPPQEPEEAPEQPTEPAAQPQQPQEQPEQQGGQQPAEQPRQGFFSWLLSLLARMFGT
jgi:hypothetical protein